MMDWLPPIPSSPVFLCACCSQQREADLQHEDSRCEYCARPICGHCFRTWRMEERGEVLCSASCLLIHGHSCEDYDPEA